MKIRIIQCLILSGSPDDVQKAINNVDIPEGGIFKIETFVTQYQRYDKATVTIVMWTTSLEKEMLPKFDSSTEKVEKENKEEKEP